MEGCQAATAHLQWPMTNGPMTDGTAVDVPLLPLVICHLQLVIRVAVDHSARWLWMSCRNSSRVMRESRNAPSMQEVIALLFCFSTPRIIMQK